MNLSLFEGRLVANPVVLKSKTESKTEICRFTLAVERSYKDKKGNKLVDFPEFVGYNKTSEFVKKYLKKGLAIIVYAEANTYNEEDDMGKIVCKKTIFRINKLEFPKGNKNSFVAQDDKDHPVE